MSSFGRRSRTRLTEGQMLVGRWGGEWTASRIWVCLVEQVQADRDGEDWGQDDEA